jgi:carbon-monoxide dehydrogenase large subunit
MGEHTMIPAAAMAANAIADATGVRIDTMPVTAEKIAMALNARRPECP